MIFQKVFQKTSDLSNWKIPNSSKKMMPRLPVDPLKKNAGTLSLEVCQHAKKFLYVNDQKFGTCQLTLRSNTTQQTDQLTRRYCDERALSGHT